MKEMEVVKGIRLNIEVLDKVRTLLLSLNPIGNHIYQTKDKRTKSWVPTTTTITNKKHETFQTKRAIPTGTPTRPPWKFIETVKTGPI